MAVFRGARSLAVAALVSALVFETAGVSPAVAEGDVRVASEGVVTRSSGDPFTDTSLAREPLPGAQVQLVCADDGRSLAQQSTDDLGRYSLSASSGCSSVSLRLSSTATAGFWSDGAEAHGALSAGEGWLAAPVPSPATADPGTLDLAVVDAAASPSTAGQTDAADPATPDPSASETPPASPLPDTPDPSASDAPPTGSPENQDAPQAQADARPELLTVTNTAIRVVTDGTPVFDADDAPGNDSSANNGIVRTNDTVQYQFQFNTDAASTQPRIESTLPVGMRWQGVPPQCTGNGTTPHGSGIYDSVTGLPGGDSRLLVCQLPDAPVPATLSVSPIAMVTTDSLNGQTKSVQFTASEVNGGAPVTSATADVTVSAGAFYDLVKASSSGPSFALGEDGTTQGFYRRYQLGIKLAPPGRTGDQQIKGMSPLASPFTFTDSLAQMSPNSRLFTWGTEAGLPCRQSSGNGTGMPNGAVGIVTGATTVNSVPNSGSISCVGTGSNVAVTVSGLDSSGSSFPTRAGDGAALPVNDRWVAAYQIYIWTPAQDVVNGADGVPGTGDDNVLNLRNTVSGFDPTDVTGQSNFGAGQEPLANNTVVSTQTATAGWGKFYEDYALGNGVPVPGSSGLRAGDIRVSIGSKVRTRADMTAGAVPVENAILCDVFDSTSQRLIQLPGNGGSPTRGVTQGGVGFTLQYGAAVASPTTFAGMRTSRCDDGDATWSTSPTDPALGGSLTPNGFRSTIDRVRMVFAGPTLPFAFNYFETGLEVYAKSSLDPALNPDGTWVSNFAQLKSGTTPVWATNNYNPLDNSGVPRGDRMQIVPGEVRLVKSLVEQSPGSGSQVSPGSDVGWRMQPAVETTGVPGVPLTDVTVTDVLPATAPRLTVNPLSVTRPPGVGVEFCELCDGSDWSATAQSPSYGVRWLFGDVVPRTPLPALEFTARVPLAAPNGATYSNTAVAGSPDDPSSLSLRSSSANAQVVAGAAVLATKTAVAPVTGLEGPLQWDLEALNASTDPITRIDLIDVLPRPGDGRTPATTGVGGYSAISVSGLPAGVTAYVTSADTSVLNAQDGTDDGYADPGSPGDGWYVTPGAGAWSCTVAQVGSPGCPTAAQVTAVRFATAEGSSAPVIAAGGTMSMRLSLTPVGNASGQDYTNRFQLRVNPEVLALPVPSPDATVRVVAPSVSIAKQTCTAADTVLCDPADDAVWAETDLVRPSEAGVFRLRVTNTGPVDGDIEVTDVLPTGLSYVPGSVASSGGDVTAFPSTWTIDGVASGESEWLTFRAVIPGTGSVTNSASAKITDEFGQTGTASDTSALEAAPTVVNVTKTLESATVDQDGAAQLVYLLTVANTGRLSSVYDLTDSLAFPSGVQVTAAEAVNTAPGDVAVNPGWNGADDAAIATGVSIAAQATHTYRVTVSATVPTTLSGDERSCAAGGGFANTAAVSGDGIDDDAYACGDIPGTGLTVAKSGPATLELGADRLTWEISVANTGALTLTDVPVTDVLPDGIAFVSATAGGAATGRTVGWTIPELLPGQTVTLSVTGSVDRAAIGAGPIRNCASAQLPDGSDPVTGCAATTITPAVIPPALVPPLATVIGVPAALAATGSDLSTIAVALAVAVLLAGFALLVITRIRRRRPRPE
ncbi:DUF11 domain-containing protein [Leifsonia sp. C5G2]|uniref:DUF7507 domain-containing protein n=1 Tax=Leifsonia sp. C5G2 TaxID=2735269 RepID=UPI0015848A58|nr:DUF11 domain-containing protein [Leifsonia sp. C5G2]NUU07647.1 DUF11 domain-containing protein [Leifsonia sp. C5G2]